MDVLRAEDIEGWLGAGGPKRRKLLAETVPQLLLPAQVPEDSDLITEPARWLLERAWTAGLPLDPGAGLARSFAIEANDELGFVAVGLNHGSLFEVDALYGLLSVDGMLARWRNRAILADGAQICLCDSDALWHVLVKGIGREPRSTFAADIWEAVLGALLIGKHLDLQAMALEANHSVQPTESPQSMVRLVEMARSRVFIHLRALCAFEPRSWPWQEPTLRESGRLAVREALRTLAKMRVSRSGRSLVGD